MFCCCGVDRSCMYHDTAVFSSRFGSSLHTSIQIVRDNTSISFLSLVHVLSRREVLLGKFDVF